MRYRGRPEVKALPTTAAVGALALTAVRPVMAAQAVPPMILIGTATMCTTAGNFSSGSRVVRGGFDAVAVVR